MDKKIMGTHTGNPTIHDLNITYRVSRNKLLPVILSYFELKSNSFTLNTLDFC